MNLYLRKVIHPQALEIYRVILKYEDGKLEIGSIGQQAAGASYFWAWGIDTVIPMRDRETQGKARTAKTACVATTRFAECLACIGDQLVTSSSQ